MIEVKSKLDKSYKEVCRWRQRN